MKKQSEGVPISGTRLKTLRLFHGMTQSALARAVGRSQGVIARYEDGLLSDPETTARIEDFLGATPGYLKGSDVHIPNESHASFRKRASATARERGKAISALAFASGILDPEVGRFLKRPDVDLPDLANEKPEAASRLLRAQWQLGSGPIGNMLWLLEAKGVSVFFLEGTSKTLDALCAWVEGRPYVLLSTLKDDGGRARYDAAHELAHLVLHQNVDLDRHDHRKVEAEADEFASCFLMPRESFYYEAPKVFSIEGYAKLRKRWGVSVQAAVRRAHDLKLVNDWQYTDAYKRMAAMGWRSGPEPGCPLRETSFIHARFFEILGDKRMNPNDLAESTGLPLAILTELMPEARKHVNAVSPSSLFDAQDDEDKRLSNLLGFN